MLFSASFMLSFLSKISFWGVGEGGLQFICLAHCWAHKTIDTANPMFVRSAALGGLVLLPSGATFAGPSARALVVPHLLFLAVKSATSRSCLPATLKGMFFVRLGGINMLYLWRWKWQVSACVCFFSSFYDGVSQGLIFYLYGGFSLWPQCLLQQGRC